MISSKGKAMCECPKHGLFETSIAVSKNFRKLCQRIGSKPNRSQAYFTSSEKKVKELLESNGYVLGRDYFHNILIPNGKRHYYVDFLIPNEKLIIEMSPFWHKLWNRQESDKRKKEYLESLGYMVVEVDEKNYKSVEDYLKWRII
jgi:hypothetical protein